MKGFLLVVICVVYSVQAWHETIGPLHIVTSTGSVPQKYYPLTADDKHATRKAGAFVSFIKIVPQINPLQVPSVGPYQISLPDIDFQGQLLLRNLDVKGINTLGLSNLEMRMNPARLDFNASLPQVSADVDFVLEAVLSGEPLNINGQFSARLSNLVLLASIGTKVAQSGSNRVYQIDSGDIVLNVAELQLAMEMNQYGEEFRGIVVQFLENNEQYSGIVDDLLRAVFKAINNELAHVTANEILQYLLGSARPSLSG